MAADEPGGGEGAGAVGAWLRASRLAHPVVSVRAKATLAAVIVVGAALALGALGLLGLLGQSLKGGVEATARAQLGNVAALASQGEVPSPLPEAQGDTFTQVVSANGRVLAAGASFRRSVPLSRLHPGLGTTVVNQVAALPVRGAGQVIGPDGDGPYLLLARTVDPDPTASTSGDGGGAGQGARVEPEGAQGVLTVYVAASLESVGRASTTVGLALAVGVPVLMALVGALVWVLCGRALRPVEAIRAEVADISDRDLHRRVPEPGTNDEVGRLARTMNAMLGRLEAGAVRQRRFVSDASHELQSPLAAIRATLEVGKAHPEAAEWEGVIGDALEESSRLQQLIEQLLTLARVDEGTLAPRMELVDLDEVVIAEARRMRQRAPRVSIDLHGVSAGQVRGDRAQLARVVQNLLDNAERHASGNVGVVLATGNGRVTLSVLDDGNGIPAWERDRVFERFTRLDEARSSDDGGTGLGLAIVREIICAHDGTVEVADVATGACLVVSLPAAAEG